MKTILLIEGDDSLRRRFRKFLEFEGFRVISQGNTQAARDFLADQPTEVDLVIVGLGQNDMGKLDVLLDQLENTRVLLTTTGEAPVLEAPYPCLSKPVPPERLVSKAYQLLSRRQAAV
jgi:DNA-binding response OmpR family regulator